jgi:hypothetical protein
MEISYTTGSTHHGNYNALEGKISKISKPERTKNNRQPGFPNSLLL